MRGVSPVGKGSLLLLFLLLQYINKHLSTQIKTESISSSPSQMQPPGPCGLRSFPVIVCGSILPYAFAGLQTVHKQPCIVPYYSEGCLAGLVIFLCISLASFKLAWKSESPGGHYLKDRGRCVSTQTCRMRLSPGGAWVVFPF